MKDFNYFYPTDVTLAHDAECQAGAKAAQFGKKALIHFDGDFLEANGVLPRVRQSLKDAGVEYYELGGVRPNPRVTLMRKGVEICKENDVDVVIAIGGGSTMDSAKGICMGAANPDKDILDFAVPFSCEKSLPMIAIPTMSGTGSEVSICAMVCDDLAEPEVKYGILSFAIMPNATLVNPELQYTLPPRQVASGCMDIISHTMTAYFTDTKNVYFSDRLGEIIMETVMKFAPMALETPDNYDVRAQIAACAMEAIVYMVSYDRDSREVSHTIENPFTVMHMLPHGTSLAVITPALMKYTYKRDVGRIAQFATRVMGVTPDTQDLEWTAREGIARFENFIRDRLHLPVRMSEVVTRDNKDVAGTTDIDALIENIKASRGFPLNPGSVYELSEDDVRAIYELAK